MSPIQKLFTLCLIVGVFIFVINMVDPVELWDWVKIIIFGCAGAIAVLVVLNRLFGYAAADFSPRLAFLDDTRLFSDSAPDRGNQSGDSSGHSLLSQKGKGDCDTLTGNVVLTLILVNDPESFWTSEDTAVFQADQTEQAQFLETEAAKYGVNLNITTKYITCTVDESLERERRDDWRDAVLKASKLPKSRKVSDYLKKAFDADEAPVAFCVNYKDRAFANWNNPKESFEYFLLYKGDVFGHELCHVFGAQDYYYPEELKQVAREYFPDSLMLGSPTPHVDSLSAYLIGWTDTLAQDAKSFLEQTEWLTEKEKNDSNRDQSKTGYGTIEKESYTYTGDILNGVPYGTGTYEFSNGNTYTGEVVYGKREGQGTFTWADGTQYTGAWSDGQVNGYGTMYYNDGYVYEGQLVNGVRHGWGTMNHPNGDSYTGEWSDGKMHGEGTYTYSSGYQQKGKWNAGVFVGG